MTLLDGRRRVRELRVRGFLDYSVRFDHVSFLRTCVLMYMYCVTSGSELCVLGDLSCRGMYVAASTGRHRLLAALSTPQLITQLKPSNAAAHALFGFNL